MGLLNRAVEAAYEGRSINGTLEAYVKLLKEALHLSITLKYLDFPPSEFSELKQIHESVTKTLLGDRSVFKFIMGQLQPMYVQGGAA